MEGLTSLRTLVALNGFFEDVPVADATTWPIVVVNLHGQGAIALAIRNTAARVLAIAFGEQGKELDTAP